MDYQNYTKYTDMVTDRLLSCFGGDSKVTKLQCGVCRKFYYPFSRDYLYVNDTYVSALDAGVCKDCIDRDSIYEKYPHGHEPMLDADYFDVDGEEL